ncbi:hypothetical protein BC567DRAFT_236393 [Phyllosticta citribraziliensis]
MPRTWGPTTFLSQQQQQMYPLLARQVEVQQRRFRRCWGRAADPREAGQRRWLGPRRRFVPQKEVVGLAREWVVPHPFYYHHRCRPCSSSSCPFPFPSYFLQATLFPCQLARARQSGLAAQAARRRRSRLRLQENRRGSATLCRRLRVRVLDRARRRREVAPQVKSCPLQLSWRPFCPRACPWSSF